MLNKKYVPYVLLILAIALDILASYFIANDDFYYVSLGIFAVTTAMTIYAFNVRESIQSLKLKKILWIIYAVIVVFIILFSIPNFIADLHLFIYPAVYIFLVIPINKNWSFIARPALSTIYALFRIGIALIYAVAYAALYAH